MLRVLFLVPLAAWGAASRGQGPARDTTAILSFTRSLSLPLNATQLFDKALEAWTWTFGKEPGAALLRTDREQGVIEGSARLNFRSESLFLREESMGPVRYRVVLRVRAGECRVLVTELVHSGNTSTTRGGVHLGTLARGDLPLEKVPGVGRSNVQRLHAGVKEQATARVTALMQAFGARLRASLEP